MEISTKLQTPEQPCQIVQIKYHKHNYFTYHTLPRFYSRKQISVKKNISLYINLYFLDLFIDLFDIIYLIKIKIKMFLIFTDIPNSPSSSSPTRP